MPIKIRVVIETEHGESTEEDILSLGKSSDAENPIGLSLAESKHLLKRLQTIIVNQQAMSYTQSHRCCPECNKKRRIKDRYDVQYRTLFGIVTIPNLRLYHCQCQQPMAKSFSVLNDWLPEHNSPELLYLETKWASLMSYGMTVDLLKDVLPVNDSLNAETVRDHLHKTAKHLDGELKDKPRFVSGCQRDWAKLPRPGKPLTVGIDGGYVRHNDEKNTHFEVIVAKSYSETETTQTTGLRTDA